MNFMFRLCGCEKICWSWLFQKKKNSLFPKFGEKKKYSSGGKKYPTINLLRNDANFPLDQDECAIYGTCSQSCITHMDPMPAVVWRAT